MSMGDSCVHTPRLLLDRSIPELKMEMSVDGLSEWVKRKVHEQHVKNLTTSWNELWNPTSAFSRDEASSRFPWTQRRALSWCPRTPTKRWTSYASRLMFHDQPDC